MFQRKHDNLMKEKVEVAKENQSLVKQMEDLKSSTQIVPCAVASYSFPLVQAFE
jgi:hypothetical protein